MCWLATGEESALAAVAEAGLPATLVPLARSGDPVVLLDHDTAEAVIEHRAVLGSGIECVSLIQAGHNLESALLLVVDGIAVAVEAKGVSSPGTPFASRRVGAPSSRDVYACIFGPPARTSLLTVLKHERRADEEAGCWSSIWKKEAMRSAG